MLFGYDSMPHAVADGDTRTITMHHVHTNEDITITYKRNGQYDPEALKKLDWFLRDWRRGEAIAMDPHLIDLVWEVSQDLHAGKPIYVICGYRAPATNAMLHRTTSGVAEFSQHTLGRAMDFYIPGVPLEQIRIEGLKLQRGGVGYYPTSGSPFVHLDTSSVRAWPRAPRELLARIFPDGRTVHIPADGHPMKGYALALADIERRGGGASPASLASARMAGLDTEAKPRTLLAALFGGGTGGDGAAAASEPVQTPDKPATPVKPVAVKRDTAGAAKAETPAPAVTRVAAAVPLPPLRPARPRIVIAAVAPSKIAAPPAPDPASPAGIVVARGTWDDAESLRQLAGGGPFKVASADVTGLVDGPKTAALAYAAAEDDDDDEAGPSPVAPTQVPLATGFGDIWMRAVVLAPDLKNYMKVMMLGALDVRDQIVPLISKPSSALAMTFSADPTAGVATDHFAGSAVVFLDTVTFRTRTAALAQ